MGRGAGVDGGAKSTEVVVRTGAERPGEVGACADLGMFDRDAPDRGVARFVQTTGGSVDWIALMEDRRPEFYLGYRGFDPTAVVPLNRHGPHRHAWTMADVRDLVARLQAAGVRVLLGAWIHECAWIDDRQPQLLMRGADGALWQDLANRSADFNPLKRLRADPEQGVADGTPFADHFVAQWNRLQADFGFDGLFVGDGGMGFRRFAQDERDALFYDFDAAWTGEFAASGRCAAHEGCALLAPPAGLDAAALARAQAADVRAHHASAWLAWTRDAWAGFYRQVADAVHARGGMLAAYNVMNYDPVLAREHGADYAQLAEAGLDVLVFQTYDWAWGPHGPLTPVADKDADTNLAALLLTRGQLGHDTRMRVVFTTETSDSVEGWRSPLEQTLREIEAYGGARSWDGRAWRPVVDGTFVVWANQVRADEWRALDAAWRRALGEPRAPRRGVVAWSDDVLGAPHEPGSYAHVKATLAALGTAPDGVTRPATAPPPAPAAPAPLTVRATPRTRAR